jgi:hypothetical protein
VHLSSFFRRGSIVVIILIKNFPTTSETRQSRVEKKLNIVYLQERDGVLVAQSLDELDVHGLLAVGSQNAQVSLTLVQSLGRLADTTNQTIGADGSLQNSSQCFVDVHLTNNFDLGDLSLLFLFISAI